MAKKINPERFKKSIEKFKKSKLHKSIVGVSHWAIYHPNGRFLLQCWTIKGTIMIVQFFPGDDGYHAFFPLLALNLIPEVLETMKQ